MPPLFLSNIRDHLFLGYAAFVAEVSLRRRLSQNCPVQPVLLPVALPWILTRENYLYFVILEITVV